MTSNAAAQFRPRCGHLIDTSTESPGCTSETDAASSMSDQPSGYVTGVGTEVADRLGASPDVAADAVGAPTEEAVVVEPACDPPVHPTADTRASTAPHVPMIRGANCMRLGRYNSAPSSRLGPNAPERTDTADGDKN